MPTLHEYKSLAPSLSFHHTLDLSPDEKDFQMHIHDEFEILLLISGDIEYCVETAVYPMKAGSLLITRHMEAHRTHILSKAPYERYCINFSAGCLEALSEKNDILSPFLNRPLGQGNLFLPDSFQNFKPLDFFKAMEKNSSKEKILIYLLTLLFEINDAFSCRQFKKENENKNTIDCIVEYVNANLFNELSLSRLSAEFFLSASQISRLFKNATGSSLWNYVQFKRLAAAQQLLREGASASEAGEKCGFKDYSVFYRAYVKQFKVSPSKSASLLEGTQSVYQNAE